MKKPTGLLVGAALMLGVAAVSGQPEFILPALVLAGASAATRRAATQRKLVESLSEMEKRLSVTEGELEAAGTALDQLKTEREFDRQLLRAPKTQGDA